MALFGRERNALQSHPNVNAVPDDIWNVTWRWKPSCETEPEPERRTEQIMLSDARYNAAGVLVNRFEGKALPAALKPLTYRSGLPCLTPTREGRDVRAGWIRKVSFLHPVMDNIV